MWDSQVLWEEAQVFGVARGEAMEPTLSVFILVLQALYLEQGAAYSWQRTDSRVPES